MAFGPEPSKTGTPDVILLLNEAPIFYASASACAAVINSRAHVIANLGQLWANPQSPTP